MIKSSYSVVGVMSGTSLDGVDFCWVNFSKNKKWDFKILATETEPYLPEMKVRLESAITFSSNQLENLNQDYTEYIGQRIYNFIQRHQIKNLDAVCSHGHTIFHQPEQGLTLQVGNWPKIANYVQQTVVCDFRVQDVAMGGQGAPLVPVGDKLLFPQHDFCLNLGGFANISFQHNKQRIAFDICPVNIILNHYVQALGSSFDKDGKYAAQGTLHQPLLEALNALNFYQNPPPKSLGLEWVQKEIYPLAERFSTTTESLLRTFVEHSAIQIAAVLKHNNLRHGLFTGGGVFNSFLMFRIADLLDHKIPMAESSLIHYKEALIFAFLGVLRLRDEVNCLQSVTGANQDHSSGKIYFCSIK